MRLLPFSLSLATAFVIMNLAQAATPTPSQLRYLNDQVQFLDELVRDESTLAGLKEGTQALVRLTEDLASCYLEDTRWLRTSCQDELTRVAEGWNSFSHDFDAAVAGVVQDHLAVTRQLLISESALAEVLEAALTEDWITVRGGGGHGHGHGHGFGHGFGRGFGSGHGSGFGRGSGPSHGYSHGPRWVPNPFLDGPQCRRGWFNRVYCPVN